RLEKGRWSVSSTGRLTLRPENAGRKVFDNSKVSDDGFSLKISNGAGTEYFTRLAHEGEHCGGFILGAEQCEDGLVCFLGNHPDAGGTCMQPASEGQSCGFRTQSAPCADGLVCRWNGGPLDALKCSQPARKVCGGIAAIQCPTGYECVLDGS